MSLDVGQGGFRQNTRMRSNREKKFEFVGLAERFDESLILLKKIFGWNNMFIKKQRSGG